MTSACVGQSKSGKLILEERAGHTSGFILLGATHSVLNTKKGGEMMEIKMLKMAFEKLYDEFQNLKANYQKLEEKFHSKLNRVAQSDPIPQLKEEFLDAKQVIEMLGICGKTLWSMENAGHIVPIRINKRRKKYSKLKIMEFMQRGINTPEP